MFADSRYKVHQDEVPSAFAPGLHVPPALLLTACMSNLALICPPQDHSRTGSPAGSCVLDWAHAALPGISALCWVVNGPSPLQGPTCWT